MADHPRGRPPIVRAVAVRAETPRLRWRRIGTRAGGAICFVPPRRCATHGQTPRRSGRKNRWDARWSEWRSLQLLILGRGITNQWEERASKDPLVPAKAGTQSPLDSRFRGNERSSIAVASRKQDVHSCAQKHRCCATLHSRGIEERTDAWGVRVHRSSSVNFFRPSAGGPPPRAARRLPARYWRLLPLQRSRRARKAPPPFRSGSRSSTTSTRTRAAAI